MMSWLEPLIDPHDLVRAAHRGNRESRAGLALLLDGQVASYERRAIETEWPRLGSHPRRGRPHGDQLLAAVGLHLTGGTHVRNAYKHLLRASDGGEFQTAVAILYALYLGAAESPTEAAEVLRQPSESAESPLERMLLKLHLGIWEVERGEIELAISTTREVHEEPSKGPAQQTRALRAIARHNVFAFHQLNGRLDDPAKLPSRAILSPLTRGVVDTSQALSKYLDDSFDRVTRSPYSRSLVFRRQDPVETELRAALLRAECLADWAERRSARARLGRYYVASNLGTQDGIPSAGFDLLRMAGDQKGLNAATRQSVSIGPLGALRTSCSAIVDQPWPRFQRPAILAMLTSGADLLSIQESDRALKRLRQLSDLSAPVLVDVLEAMVALLPLASDRAQTPSSRFVRALIDARSEALFVQPVWRIVRALRWSAVTKTERGRWIAFVDEHAQDEGDLGVLAAETASALFPVEEEDVAQILLASYERSPNLGRLARVVDAEIPLSRDLTDGAIDCVASELAAIRAKAAKGSFGFGGIDVALLMLRLLSGRREGAGWDALVEFLFDPRVAVDAKTRTLNELSSSQTKIPRSIQARLREGLATLEGFESDIGGSLKSLEGAKLRLWIKIGRIDRSELLSRLSALAGDLDAEGRREAASTLPSAQRRLSNDTSFTLGLTMTRDRDVSVRARAGWALGRLRRERAGEIGTLAVRRLEELLSEPGHDVPSWTLIGLHEAATRGQVIPETILAQVQRVEHSHPSRRVKHFAEQLLKQGRGDG